MNELEIKVINIKTGEVEIVNKDAFSYFSRLFSNVNGGYIKVIFEYNLFGMYNELVVIYCDNIVHHVSGYTRHDIEHIVDVLNNFKH